MARFRRQNIPADLSKDNPTIVSFLQSLLDAPVVEIGASIKWGNATMPKTGIYVAKSGQTLNKTDFPEFWGYAGGDAAYTTTATTVTLPVDAGFIVRIG